MKINILLVGKDEEALRRIRSCITDEQFAVVGDSAGGARALEAVENSSPDILILYQGTNDTDALNLAERVIQHKPRTFVVLITEAMSVESLQAANAAGVHNVVLMPSAAREFEEYLRTVYNAEKSRIDALSENQRVTWASKVVTVFGAKGGLGKTTIATNLAVKLAQQHKKVVLLDLDLQFGDVHIFLDIEPKDTIAELAQDVFAPNIDSVRSYMTVHSSGLHVLCAPKSPEYADVVSSERIQSLLSLLRSYYDYVIIDTASNFSDVTLTAIEASSLILFVTGLDISILKNSRLSMSILESLKQKDKVRIVINRAVEVNTISVADVQHIIDAPILSRIPSDYMTAVAALNRGMPFVMSAPGGKLSMAIGDIANLLLTGADNYDIQRLTPRERKALLRRYKAKERAEKRPLFGKRK
jgi:pilus assembly protein CpaE